MYVKIIKFYKLTHILFDKYISNSLTYTFLNITSNKKI